MGFILSHGAAIHYEEYGSGHPLILLPDLLGTIENTWRRFVPEFARKFHTVVVDLRGHGKTNNPAGVLTTQLLVDDLGTLIDTLGFDHILLCGYGLGGYVGLRYGVRNPGKVRGLVVHGTKFFWDETPIRQRVGSLNPERILHPASEDARTFQQEHRTSHEQMELIRNSQQLIASLPRDGIDITTLQAAHFPVLVSVGENDEFIPQDEARNLAGHLPLGRVGVLPATHHAIETVEKQAFLSMAFGFFGDLGGG